MFLDSLFHNSYNYEEWRYHCNVFANGRNPVMTYKYDPLAAVWRKYYNIYDELGSVALVMNDSGRVVESNQYKAFGVKDYAYKERPQATGYIGKEKDTESNLADHGVRKYDSDLGRFLCPDAMWEKYISYTPYQYAGNDPINLLDWNGKYWDKSELSSSDLKTFNNHLNLINKSEKGFQLVNFLEKAPFKVVLLSREMATIAGAVDFPHLNTEGDIIKIDVWLDYDNGGLKTTIEELVHVNQFAQTENKQKFIDDVKSEIKNKKYKDRKHEKEAKKITNEINDEIFDSIIESNKLPKVIDNKLPSEK